MGGGWNFFPRGTGFLWCHWCVHRRGLFMQDQHNSMIKPVKIIAGKKAMIRNAQLFMRLLVRLNESIQIIYLFIF